MFIRHRLGPTKDGTKTETTAGRLCPRSTAPLKPKPGLSGPLVVLESPGAKAPDSPQQRVCYPHPRRGLHCRRVHHHDLPKDDRGKGVAVHLVDASVDDQVADYSEKNQKVHPGVKHYPGEN